MGRKCYNYHILNFQFLVAKNKKVAIIILSQGIELQFLTATLNSVRDSIKSKTVLLFYMWLNWHFWNFRNRWISLLRHGYHSTQLLLRVSHHNNKNVITFLEIPRLCMLLEPNDQMLVCNWCIEKCILSDTCSRIS